MTLIVLGLLAVFAGAEVSSISNLMKRAIVVVVLGAIIVGFANAVTR